MKREKYWWPFLSVVLLAACGGGSGVQTGGGGDPSPPPVTASVVVRTVVDAGLVYPYGFTLYQDSKGVEQLFLGNTFGGLISSPGGMGAEWSCSIGLENPQIGEVYRYEMGTTVVKQYVKSYYGFVERSAYYRRPDGGVDVYFVENRDGHVIKIDTGSLNGRPISDETFSTEGARAYDVKVANLAGLGADVIFSTYSSNQLRVRRADTGQIIVLADHLSENRAVEIYAFAGDLYPSIVTTALGASREVDPSTGWVSVLRNSGAYRFDEHRFNVRGAAYARLVALDSNQPNALYLLVSHGLRDEIEAPASHGLSIYRYDASSNSIELMREYSLPYAYRFDVQDLNGDGVMDIVLGGHDGSGALSVLLSKGRSDVSYDLAPLDQGLVAVNDLKFGQARAGAATLYALADNGNGCPRKTGGSRLVKYELSLPLTLAGLRALKF